jgi:hypothetical protein
VSDTGLADVLAGVLAYGGYLKGARRWTDSPLTLTHVCWEGLSGQRLTAARQPSGDVAMSPGEREAWVQLAVRYPSASAGPAGPASPWMTLQVTQDEVRTLASNISRSSRPTSGASWASRPLYPTAPPPPWDATPHPAAVPPASQSMGSWQLHTRPGQEASVIPCVEVELPLTLDGVAADFARDYQRDVALHFARAARTIAEVREVRGWMRADRLVLAARMGLETGGGPPTRAEMDHAARLLASALAQRTLPYTRMTFAEPVEWQSGSALPD